MKIRELNNLFFFKQIRLRYTTEKRANNLHSGFDLVQ